MASYYVQLALRSLRRNVALTALIIAAVAVGIGATMTVFTVLLAMSGDPIPAKSSQLFAPQIDVWGPPEKGQISSFPISRLPAMLPYRDAMALVQARAGGRRSAMYGISQVFLPPQGVPFPRSGRAANRDFFTMFQVPFRAGSAWSVRDEAEHANVVVLGAKLAAQLFPGVDAVGQKVTLEAGAFRVVGVLQPWNPEPRFYDVVGNAFGRDEEFFLPLSTAIDHQLDVNGSMNCHSRMGQGFAALLESTCVWVQFWVELPDAAAARAYQQFLTNYASDQRKAGRFAWPPMVALSNVRQWLQLQNIVPDEVRLNALLSLGFLLVCLVNAISLMLARFNARSGMYAIRRALGASRLDIFLQCMTETALVGALGGALGLALTSLGLSGQRAILKSVVSYTSQLTHLDGGLMALTVLLAVGAALLSGLYPAWRAARTSIGWQLKEQ